MSNLKSLQDYVFVSKYARTVNGRKETWEQAVDRVMNMHSDFLESRYNVDKVKMSPYFMEAYSGYLNQEALGAQRNLQWGGAQLLKHHFRSYNCSASYVNRVEYFSQLMYILLAGAGVGYSVQKHHVAMLPEVLGPKTTKVGSVYHIRDEIEGWADSVKVLVESYFYNKPLPKFDASKVRKKGAFISGGFKAPGPEPLLKALSLVEGILKNAVGRKLTTLEAHEISCIIADSVIAGGVRRAALIALFSADDNEMMNCKTGNWFINKPYLARANNSVVILPSTSRKTHQIVFEATREFGEPGIVYLSDTEIIVNPCAEIGLYPTRHNKDGSKDYGFAVCNLTEINGRKVKSLDDFLRAGKVGAILGTIQAAYTDFPYLGDITEDIVRRDALIGVGITGMAENPDILFNPDYQQLVAKEIKKVNKEVANIIGINYAARTTTIKPAGTSSSLLGTSSGIHPFDSKRYIRHTQVNKEEQAGIIMGKVNPETIEQSVYNFSDNVIAFPVEKASNVIVKADIKALDFLDMVKSTQANWIEPGTNWDHSSYEVSPKITHNVSNTCNVEEGAWEDVEKYLWNNRKYFCGVSLLGASSSLNYPQAPFTEVLDEIQLSEKYGAAAILAGGLNVDAIHTFGNLWVAIDTALGRGEILKLSMSDITNLIADNTKITESGTTFMYRIEGVLVSDINAVIAYQEEKLRKKQDWVRRFNKFAKKYLRGDIEETGRCLKEVSIFHKWQQLQNIKTINWEEIEWEEEVKDAGADVAAACHGGSCEINI